MSRPKTASPRRTPRLILSSETLHRLDSFREVAAAKPTDDCLPPSLQGPGCVFEHAPRHA